jgi:hypothetical protein
MSTATFAEQMTFYVGLTWSWSIMPNSYTGLGARYISGTSSFFICSAILSLDPTYHVLGYF